MKGRFWLSDQQWELIKPRFSRRTAVSMTGGCSRREFVSSCLLPYQGKYYIIKCRDRTPRHDPCYTILFVQEGPDAKRKAQGHAKAYSSIFNAADGFSQNRSWYDGTAGSGSSYHVNLFVVEKSIGFTRLDGIM